MPKRAKDAMPPMPNASQHGTLTIRPMATGDAAAVADMARELAAALDDPEPALDPDDLARDGLDRSAGSIAWWRRWTAA